MSIIAKKANPAEIDTPATGKVSLYVDCNDGKIKIKDDSGCVQSLMYTQSGTCFGIIDLLVVGGGGGGGGTYGGGGGAGGVVYCGNYILCTACHDVSIGEGGVGANGGNTCFDNIIAYGGGLGAVPATPNGCDGGSGGGASSGTYVRDGWGGNGCPGQGTAGGSIFCGRCERSCPNGGGGGGAGCTAKGAIQGWASNGGDGLPFDISGETCYYGAGGGGAGRCTTGVGKGGCGGGGDGGGACEGSNGSFYGAGGGGGGFCGYKGVVIIRYKTNGNSGIGCATGGTITCCNGYTIHTFDNTAEAQTFCITGFSDFNPLA